MAVQEKILVVDDEPSIRKYLQTLLEVDGFEVETVNSGREAIKRIGDGMRPDFVILDVLMPEMSGIEATRWIKDQNPVIKIILLSSEVSKEFISDGMKMGIDGYLLKDCSKEMLFEAIHTVMRGRK